MSKKSYIHRDAPPTTRASALMISVQQTYCLSYRNARSLNWSRDRYHLVKLLQSIAVSVKDVLSVFWVYKVCLMFVGCD